MKRLFRENLELDGDSGSPRVLCARCGFDFGGEEEWRERSHQKRQSPTAGGPLMKDLEGQFLLKQLFCPQCKTLLDSAIVEVEP